MSDGITIRDRSPGDDDLVVKLLCRLIALCVPVWVAPLAAQQVADHIAMGVAANQAHDPRTALQHFQAALEQDSSSHEAHWRAAMTLLDLGEQIGVRGKSPERDSLYAEAERYANQALAADSNGADGHFALAATVGRRSLSLGQKARIRRASVIRREALRTIELNPRHDGAYHILGRWNAEIMRTSGLSRFFAKTFLGAGVFGQASWSRAIANMKKAVELDSSRIVHRLELARIYADRKQLGDAETQLHAVESLPVREIMDSAYKEQAADLRRRISKR
jgi:regulator of microtubule dynamics protein 3